MPSYFVHGLLGWASLSLVLTALVLFLLLSVLLLALSVASILVWTAGFLLAQAVVTTVIGLIVLPVEGACRRIDPRSKRLKKRLNRFLRRQAKSWKKALRSERAKPHRRGGRRRRAEPAMDDGAV